MKIKHIFLTVLATIVTTSAIAQEFQGVATYKSKRKLNIKLDSTQMNADMQKRIMERMKKQFEKTYMLTFDKEASIYKEEESLGAPQTTGGNIRMVMVDARGGDIIYKNTKEHRYVNQNEVFGKIFLVKDELKKLDWKLGSETKNIGEYTCYKATTTRMQRVIQRTNINVNGKNESKDDKKSKPEMREITITAWYTPQIPINNGPGNYYGLPGLILEVNDGTETTVCSKIVMNPKTKIRLTEPSKGKVVKQEKFDAIMEKKMKEMRERQRGRSNGEGHVIRIGG